MKYEMNGEDSSYFLVTKKASIAYSFIFMKEMAKIMVTSLSSKTLIVRSSLS